MGKRAVLLQNVLKLILQEISVDCALVSPCGVYMREEDSAAKLEGVGSLWWLLTTTTKIFLQFWHMQKVQYERKGETEEHQNTRREPI